MLATNEIKTTLPFCLDSEYLMELAEKYRLAYAQADPFPHIVLDNFLPEPILDAVLQEFPQPNQIDWQQFNNLAEKKLASKSESHMGDMTRFLLYQLNSSIFIDFLEKLTGIDGLLPDPHFVGGGLHQIQSGGYLKVHVDFNRHERLKLDRRLNLLIYLNKDWHESYGGCLELWDRQSKVCHRKIHPFFNRCVIFSTTDFSYHGHPEPLTCPKDRTRKSLALYYYSNGRPQEEVSDEHSTIFCDQNGAIIPDEHLFKSFSGKSLIKKLLPPILFDILSAAKK